MYRKENLKILAALALCLALAACNEEEPAKKPDRKLETYSQAMASESAASESSRAESESAEAESSAMGSVPVADDGMPLPGQTGETSSSSSSAPESEEQSGASESGAPLEIVLTDENVPVPSEYAAVETENTATTSWQAVEPTGYAKDFGDTLTNLRVQYGLAPLNYYSELNSVAFARLTEAATAFSHIRPDGRECRTVMDDFGLAYIGYGELLARNTADMYGAYDLWFRSPVDLANMIRPNYTGYCIVTGLVGGVQYWAVIFVI